MSVNYFNSDMRAEFMSVERRRRRNSLYDQLSIIVFNSNRDICDLDKRRVLMLLCHKLSERERQTSQQQQQQAPAEL